MPRHAGRFISVFALLLGSTSPAAAYLAQNHEFNYNLDGWTVESGNWSWIGFDGQFGLEAAQVTSVAGTNSLSQCSTFTRVGEDIGLRFIAFARTVDHTSPVSVSMELYASTDCSGGAIDISSFENSNPPLDIWTPTLDDVVEHRMRTFEIHLSVSDHGIHQSRQARFILQVGVRLGLEQQLDDLPLTRKGRGHQRCGPIFIGAVCRHAVGEQRFHTRHISRRSRIAELGIDSVTAAREMHCRQQ